MSQPCDFVHFWICYTSRCPEQCFYGSRVDMTPPLPSGGTQRYISRFQLIYRTTFRDPQRPGAGSDRLDSHRNIAQGIEKYNISKNERNRTGMTFPMSFFWTFDLRISGHPIVSESGDHFYRVANLILYIAYLPNLVQMWEEHPLRSP